MACGSDPTPGITGTSPSTPSATPAAAPRHAKVILGGGFAATVAVRGASGKLCTGVVISNDVVITASHCFCEETPDSIWIGSSISPDAVYRIGFNQGMSLKPEVKHFSKKFCGTNDGIDLAVVVQANEAALVNSEFHEHFPIAPLTATAFKGTIVGFGASDHSSVGGVKRHANIDVEACTDAHVAAGEECQPGLEWISFSETGVDTCKGDSGGPLYMHAADGTLRLVGLTSRKRGGGSAPYCGDGGIYVNLATEDVISWINAQ